MKKRLRDSQFDKRRTILGVPVLVRVPVTDMDGLVKSTFSVRIKFPGGDMDTKVEALYYWQAFNEARRLIIKN